RSRALAFRLRDDSSRRTPALLAHAEQLRRRGTFCQRRPRSNSRDAGRVQRALGQALTVGRAGCPRPAAAEAERGGAISFPCSWWGETPSSLTSAHWRSALDRVATLRSTATEDGSHH